MKKLLKNVVIRFQDIHIKKRYHQCLYLRFVYTVIEPFGLLVSYFFICGAKVYTIMTCFCLKKNTMEVQQLYLVLAACPTQRRPISAQRELLLIVSDTNLFRTLSGPSFCAFFFSLLVSQSIVVRIRDDRMGNKYKGNIRGGRENFQDSIFW